MTTTILSEPKPVLVAEGQFNWSAVFAGALVAAATGFFLVTLGAGFGLTLTARPGTTFLTLGAIYVLAAQAFGFAAGGHVAGRIIGPAIETTREEEIRAGLHGLAVWAISVVFGLVIVALAAIAGASQIGTTHDAAHGDSAVATYWSDILLRPTGAHAMANGNDLDHDKTEAARVLAADLHPGARAAAENRADLVRLTALDAGLSSSEAEERVRFVEDSMRQDLDAARKAAGYASLWTALMLLFGAVVTVAAAISARWEDDKIHFSMKRRY